MSWWHRAKRARVRFALSWYTPNFRKYWITPTWHFRQHSPASGQWKNWYATEWTGSETIAVEVLSRWQELRDETFAFRDAVYSSTLPVSVIDAAAANLSILKSPTTLRLEDGTFYGWEGCHPAAGSCEGSCTHVWNYQQALPFLFPALERSMREADYKYNLNAAGGLSFRLSLPLGTNYTTERPCADGQFGNVLKLYRDWKLSGDTQWLAKLWPSVKQSIDYAWSPDNPDHWDPEQTGVLWGRQHHTLDMELFGPNSWLTGFYLGALKAAAEMADALGDPDVSAHYSTIYARGRAWVDQNLFNGEYFTQQVDLSDSAILAPFIKSEKALGVLGDTVEQLYWSAEHKELKYQLGGACFIDQALGQWHAGLYGLGDVLDRTKVRTSLESTYRNNFMERLGDIYNPCRVFGMDDESGIVIATWPEGAAKPAVPVPYAQETMHGMEYAFGQLLMAYGMLEEGIKVTAGVRDRYDGAAPQSVERNRMRLQLCPVDGKLGRHDRPLRLQLRRRPRPYRLRAAAAARTASSGASGRAPMPTALSSSATGSIASAGARRGARSEEPWPAARERRAGAAKLNGQGRSPRKAGCRSRVRRASTRGRRQHRGRTCPGSV